jgi:hypothetical protein
MPVISARGMCNPTTSQYDCGRVHENHRAFPMFFEPGFCLRVFASTISSMLINISNMVYDTSVCLCRVNLLFILHFVNV